MAMASIYWDLEHYSAVERIFRQSAEFCSDNDTWKLNVAHTFFMQASICPAQQQAEPSAACTLCGSMQPSALCTRVVVGLLWGCGGVADG